ncbi:ribosomal protein L16, partial [Plasmodium falciparum Dd2]
VPSGKTIFSIPTISPFNTLGFDDPVYRVLKKAAAKVAIPCVFRTQNNLFRVHNIKYISPQKVKNDQLKHFNQFKSKLFQKKDEV